MSQTKHKEPKLLFALLPLVLLCFLLAISVYLFKADSSYGGNQIALILATALAIGLAVLEGHRWEDMQAAMVRGVSTAAGAIFILLAVGSLIGSWIVSGIVPTMIHYGLAIMEPSFFYPATCLICALVAVSIGSSWTVAGTLGVALIGVAQGLGMSPAMTAGAVISGAYFGDKLSPLSDTTNLAPAVAGTELFAHIRHMLWTTIPSFVIAMIIFTTIGLTQDMSGAEVNFGDLPQALEEQFNTGWYMLFPLFAVLVMSIKRVPAFPAILIGALLGALFAVIFQPEKLIALADLPEHSRGMQMFAGAWKSLFNGYQSNTGHEGIDQLFSRGGMSSMLNTVWIIICAMAFGAVMEEAGYLRRIVTSILKMAKSTAGLISTTLATCIGTNIITGDQYMSIVLPGRIYQEEYKKRGLAPINLSRALEDSGTLTSPLVPWNSCGAYMAATLGVATFDYLPYVFFNLLNPVVALVMAWVGFKIVRTQTQPNESHSAKNA